MQNVIWRTRGGLYTLAGDGPRCPRQVGGAGNVGFGTLGPTSPGGTAAMEATPMDGPTVPFDLSIRLVGSDGTVLRSRCMTIIGK